MIKTDVQDIRLNPRRGGAGGGGGGGGGIIQAGSVPGLGPGPRPPPKMLLEYDNEMQRIRDENSQLRNKK